MYEPDTILKLKEPRSTEDNPFPYDRVRVIGESPLNHGALSGGTWEGPNGRGVIITPLNGFESTVDEPYGKLQQLYDVESIPEHEGPVDAPVRVINSSSGSAGPTPEEVFTKEAPGKPSEDGKRGRSRPSPLGDVEAPAGSGSPLGDSPPESE